MERKSTKRRLNGPLYRTQSTDRQTRRLHIFKIFAFIWPLDNTLIILVYSEQMTSEAEPKQSALGPPVITRDEKLDLRHF